MKNEEKQLLSIGEIAKSLDITRRMILNYEAKGLIEADKKEGVTGNRYYTVDTLTRIRTIRVFQNLGLSLDDIKKYLDEDADLRPMIARLEKIRDELNLNIEKLKERVKSDNDFEFRIMTVPAQTVFSQTFRAPTVEERKVHLRKVITGAIEATVRTQARECTLSNIPFPTPTEFLIVLRSSPTATENLYAS